jgi:hypothetical protein
MTTEPTTPAPDRTTPSVSQAARAERDAFRSALLASLPEGATVIGEATDMQWVVATDGRLIATISEARVLQDDATRRAFTAALLAAGKQETQP